jgi:hypothetical protein
MRPTSFVRTRSSIHGKRKQSILLRQKLRALLFEQLEDRRMLALVQWISDTSSFWDLPSNWSTGSVPTSADDVLIDRGTANPVINIRSGVQSIKSLQSNETLILSGGSLSVAQTILGSSLLTLAGGALANSVIDGSRLGFTSLGGTLSGVTVSGDVNLSADNSQVLIAGGTTFANAHMLGNYSGIGFAPGQTLSGNILFEGSGTGYRTVEMNGTNGLFTIGPSGAIKTASDFKGSGQIGINYRFGGSMTLVNQGLISSETNGQSIFLLTPSQTNSGTIQAINGGAITPSINLAYSSSGVPAEVEANNTIATAGPIALTPSGAGHSVGVMSGTVSTSSDVDTFQLGNMRGGDIVNLLSTRPAQSTLDPKIELRNANGAILASSMGTGTIHWTLPQNDIYYVAVSANTAASAGSQSTYVLNVDVADATAPSVISTTLPGSTAASGSALNFDGITDHVMVSDAASLRPTSGVTLEAWVNFATDYASAARVIAAKAAGTGTSNSYAIWYESGALRGCVGTTSGIAAQLTYTWTPVAGNWYHVAFSYDSATGTQRLFVNGLPVNTNTTTLNVLGGASAYDSNPVLLGADKNNQQVSAAFSGLIDEVRIWNAARSQVDVQTFASISLGGDEPGLAAYWRFEEGSGNTAIDSTANANVGSLGGSLGGLAQATPAWAISGAPLFSAATPTVVTALDSFTLTFDEDLLPSAAIDANNYSLREAGTNGTFGDTDDTMFALSTSYLGLGSRTVKQLINLNPLQPGRYRLQTLPSLSDRGGNSVATFTRDFVIANPSAGTIENNTGNDSIPGATPLPMTEFPVASGFFTTLGVASLVSSSDVDYWRFDAQAGDQVTTAIEGDSATPTVQLYSASNSALVSNPRNYTIPGPGNYYLRVSGSATQYRLRLDQTRGSQLEVESNDSQTNATNLSLAGTGGIATAIVGAALPVADSSGDYYRLTNLALGNTISLSVAVASFGTMALSDVRLSVYSSGATNPVATSTSGNLNYAVATAGTYFIRVEGLANRGLRAQYVLTTSIADGVAPNITALTLPAAESVSTDEIDRFTISFSEDLAAATVNNPASYDLRSAGLDGLFDTVDDQTYMLATSPTYSSGLSTNLRLIDGPLQPGKYRFTASNAGAIRLLDRAGNPLAAAFVRSFTINPLSPFVVENRNNDTILTATPLAALGTVGDGSFTQGASYTVGSNPYHLASADLNGDGKLDVVASNYSSNSVSVLLGNGDGTFRAAVHYSWT